MDASEVKRELKNRIDEKFAGAPPSRAVFELQEEILANCTERYFDLAKGGMEEETAMKSVIDNIGDVDELVAALPADDLAGPWSQQEARERSAMISTIAAGLYILAVVLLVVGMWLGATLWGTATIIGIAMAGLVCIIPTCMLVYNAKMHPKSKTSSSTMVDEFKAWSNDEERAKNIRKAVSAFLWPVVIVTYFLVSFSTGAWYITWVIYLIGGCLETLVNLIFNVRK